VSSSAASSGASSGSRAAASAHIELAGHDIGDEAGAVFAEEFDLAFEAGGGGIQFSSFLPNRFNDQPLLVSRRLDDWEPEEFLGIQTEARSA
jgi:hypothetical protein